MDIELRIDQYIDCHPEPKRRDLLALHLRCLQIMPACRLWFFNGKDETGKTVSNPSIGYGTRVINYADGTTRDFYRIGLSANKTGISVYILGIRDKTFLAKTFGDKIGKASVTGYCIKFKSLKDIDVDVLESAMRYGAEYE